MPSKWQREEFFAGSPTAQTFTVPAGVSIVYLTMVGGGGGGGRATGAGPAIGGGGGGAGECCIRMPLKVTPADSISVEVGDMGLGSTRAAGASTNSTDGGSSIFGSVHCAGGFGGGNTGGNQPGASGGGAGRALGVLGGDGVIGTRAGGSVFVGGASGGGYTNTTVGARAGGPAAGVAGTSAGTNDGTRSAGGSGASSQWGVGGIGGDGGVLPTDSNGRAADTTHYGAGGGGAGGYGSSPIPDDQCDGGNGAPGYILVEWFAEV